MGRTNTRAASADEKKAIKREKERKRYARIKCNPELYAQYKAKNRLKYQKRKKEKKVLSIKEMTPRSQKLQRQKWRLNFNAYYRRKKENMSAALRFIDCNSPPVSDNDSEEGRARPHIANNSVHDPISVVDVENSPQSGRSTRSSVSPLCRAPSEASSNNSGSTELGPKLRRLRYKKDKEIASLVQKLHGVRKINEVYRKRLTQLEKKTEDQQDVREGLLRSYNELRSDTAKQVLSKSLEHHVKTQLKNKRALGKLTKVFRRRMNPGKTVKQVKVDVKKFFQSDENSSMAAGKKEYVTKNSVRMQKRYMNDSVHNIYKKFISMHSYRLSYATFCRLRPFWVLFASQKPSAQCLCIIHENFQLLVSALHSTRIINNSNILEEMCCDKNNVECLSRKCQRCIGKHVTYLEFDNSKDFSYWSWVYKTENIVQNGIPKTIKLVKKVKIVTKPKKAIEIFEDLVVKFLDHCTKMKAQQDAIRTLKEQLQSNEAIIHIDFSENYKCQYTREIQSAHFGGSKKQISIHTCVLYFFDQNNIKRTQCFATVSPNIRHDATAVWAHVDPILDFLKEASPRIDTLHFISDSATAQYRNFKIFFIITALKWNHPNLKSLTWNYTEAGHGKGAPDGVGAVLKRTADRVVSHGHDIADFDAFFNQLQSNVDNIIIKEVLDHAILEKDILLPTQLRPFKGTQKVRQVVWHESKRYQVTLRKLSCALKSCVNKPIVCCHGKHLGFHDLNFLASEEVTIDKQYCNNSKKANSRPKRQQKIKILSDITFKPVNCELGTDYDNCIDSFRLPTAAPVSNLNRSRAYCVSSKENVPIELLADSRFPEIDSPISFNDKKPFDNNDEDPLMNTYNSSEYNLFDDAFGNCNDSCSLSTDMPVASLQRSRAFCALSEEELPTELVGCAAFSEINNCIAVENKELSENINNVLFNMDILNPDTQIHSDISAGIGLSNSAEMDVSHLKNQNTPMTSDNLIKFRVHAEVIENNEPRILTVKPQNHNVSSNTVSPTELSINRLPGSDTDVALSLECSDFPYKCDMWVLVKYETKKRVKHYIGQIIKIDQNNMIEINFLRKSTRSSNKLFSWPRVSDKDCITQLSVKKILNTPEVNRRGQYVFEDLENYVIE